MSDRESVFISYSHVDRDIVLAAIAIQRELDFAAWTDFRNIPAGSNWSERIDQAISNADLLVLCWTASSASSRFVRREWEAALQHGTRVIPVLLDETPLPDELAHIQALTMLRPWVQHLRDYSKHSLWQSRVGLLQWLFAMLAGVALIVPVGFWGFSVRTILPAIGGAALFTGLFYLLCRQALNIQTAKDMVNRVVLDELKQAYGRNGLLFNREELLSRSWERDRARKRRNRPT
jgi:hypothetical protein